MFERVRSVALSLQTWYGPRGPVVMESSSRSARQSHRRKRLRERGEEKEHTELKALRRTNTRKLWRAERGTGGGLYRITECDSWHFFLSFTDLPVSSRCLSVCWARAATFWGNGQRSCCCCGVCGAALGRSSLISHRYSRAHQNPHCAETHLTAF